MKTRWIHWLLSIWVILSTGACVMGSRPRHSDFLGSYSALTPDPKMEGVYRYQNPKVSAERIQQSYLAVIIEPVVIYFDPEASRFGINPDDVKELADFFRSELAMALNDRYFVVENPGPNVMRIRLAIVGAMPSRLRLSAHYSETALNLGNANLEAEFLDAKTSERIAAVMDTRHEKEFVKFHDRSVQNHAKGVIYRWIRLLRSKLDSVYGT